MSTVLYPDQYRNKTDSYYERKLRELVDQQDAHNRGKDEDYIAYFYSMVLNDRIPSISKIPHSDLFYIRAALEAKFEGRYFSIEEIKTLLEEELGVGYGPSGPVYKKDK